MVKTQRVNRITMKSFSKIYSSEPTVGPVTTLKINPHKMSDVRSYGIIPAEEYIMANYVCIYVPLYWIVK